MKYYRLKTTNPYENLAVEEFLLRTADDDVFMLWQNEPTVVIGKNQNAYAEVDLAAAREKGIHVSRRITGGGAVYHDLGNINYTFITSQEKAEVLDYAYFCEPILRALAELGLSCSLSGRNDLECEGRKFSGNAQHASDGKILHHGTILFDTDVSEMASVLKVDREKLAYRGVHSHRSRVVNLREMLGEGTTAEGLVSHIERYVLETMQAEEMPTPTNPQIDALRARNESDEWIYSEKRYLTNYTVEKRKKYPFGVVKVAMALEKDTIERILISGDFFGRLPIEELERELVGQNPTALREFDPAPYIAGMTLEEFAELIRE
ncbi:MAG: lipoate--protein ligase [Clostridia bacterium]|nr:lipoate--protein ligase [Clostridia bacterium]